MSPSSRPPALTAALSATLLLSGCSSETDPVRDPIAGAATEATGVSLVGDTGEEHGSSAAATTSEDLPGGATSEPGSEASTLDPTGVGGGASECPDGVTYACGDGTDNDGDGSTDLADPECTGPCDDDEGSFATGIPGDNIDCFQDCFFDGNSGHGDDECWWNVTCDPANPGRGGLCEYRESGMCGMESPYDNDTCVDNCLSRVPNGCDCFGCCTVEVEGEALHIWLGSGTDCSLDNLDACGRCTPSEFCKNDCDPDACELCFGAEQLPEGCEDPGGCENGLPCSIDEEGNHGCGAESYCLTGCCVPNNPVPVG